MVDDGASIEKKSERDALSEKGSGAPRIRTYAADMGRAIRARGETLSSIALKEQSAPKREVPKKPSPSRTRLFVFGGALLVVLGIALVAGVFFLVQKGDGNTSQTLPQSIIFANSTLVVDVADAKDVLALLGSERESASLLLGEIQNVVLVRNGVALSPTEAARALGVPDALAREVLGIMLGVHSFDRNQPFIILQVAAYDRSFSALLSWEKEMGRDLGAFFKPTGGALPAPTLSFTDDVIRNVDVRRSQTAWPILYSYPSRTSIIITTNEYTLREVLARLSSAQ